MRFGVTASCRSDHCSGTTTHLSSRAARVSMGQALSYNSYPSRHCRVSQPNQQPCLIQYGCTLASAFPFLCRAHYSFSRFGHSAQSNHYVLTTTHFQDPTITDGTCMIKNAQTGFVFYFFEATFSQDHLDSFLKSPRCHAAAAIWSSLFWSGSGPSDFEQFDTALQSQ